MSKNLLYHPILRKIFVQQFSTPQVFLNQHVHIYNSNTQRSINIKINNKSRSLYMTYSPSRKIHTNYGFRKQSYTQNRQQNINQTNLSQYSPSIRSPKLNQQSQYTKLHNVGAVEELKIKLQTVLKHNSHLLNENATLSEMVNNLKIQLQLRTRRQQTQTVKISVQYTTIIQELKQSLRIKQSQVARMLDQISRLHDECFKIQMIKNSEIKQMAQTHEREMTVQIRNIKKSSQDNKQLTQLQIRKLKQSIQLKNFQYEALKSTSKSQIDKLRGQIQQYRTQISHFNQLKELQLRQINQKYKQIIHTTSKSNERQKAMTVTRFQTKIKKLKQDIINKTLQIEQASKKAVLNAEDHQIQIEGLNTQRQRLLQQINELQISSKENILKQKSKIRQLSELQIKNLENIAQNQRDLFKSQINKLIAICDAKTEEIKKLYNNIAEIKQKNLSQKHDNDKLIQALRKRIKSLQQDSLQEIQLLKIKMAQLHQADIKGLQKYYQNQLAVLAKYSKELQQGRSADRSKLHSLLQENDLLRKNFDTELTKYKAKIQDYKVKFAAAHLQFRQQITSLGTKMELTSQTLLRQAQQKQKGAQFFQNQKKKFHLLIQGKDKQIASAYETMSKLKQLHGQQITQLRQQISALRDNLANKVKQLKDLRKQLQDQFERKSQRIIQQRQQTPNQVLEKENKQLRDRIEILQKELFQKIKQIQFIHKENKSLQQQVGLRAGFLQTMQLQSSAAIQDQRSKLKILMNQNQVAMKDYYQSKLATKNKDIDNLQTQLHEKQNDIRQLIVKYNQLEKRLKQILQAQDRLSQFEKKIMNLGLDQNLVKNMSELFAKYRK